MTDSTTVTTLTTLDIIRRAAERIKPVARVTPLVDVSGPAGRPLFLKCENLQPAGAFKIRGAYNMVAQLTPAQRAGGVITYSSGNHGQAMALAARTLGAPAVVVMPTTAPQVKIDGAKSFGAEVILAGATSADRRARAEAEAAARGLTMVPPFDHEWIIAGQGTAGLEILEQCPDVAAVLVPIGGGGLAAGVSAAIKQSAPHVAVIGVEPSGAAKMKASVDAGHPVTLPKTETIADGLMPVRPGDLHVRARAEVRRSRHHRRGSRHRQGGALDLQQRPPRRGAERRRDDGGGVERRARRGNRRQGPDRGDRQRRQHGGRETRGVGVPIETFAMERMQSTWENIVDYDMSESGVRPLTLRELVEMGLDLEAFLDQPLGY